VAAVTHAGTGIWTTTAGNKTFTGTPAASDLIVVVAPASGVATSAVTDNNADGLGTYTQADSDRTGWGSATTGHLTVWVRNALIGSATSTVFTATQSGSTGGGLDVFRISGMTRTGAAAVRQTAGQSSGTSGTTPAPVFGAAPLTGNPVIGAVCNAQTTAGSVITQRANFTEASDLAYSTPGSGLETMFRSSGETATTQTWGSTSGSAFGSVVAEFDTSAPETSPQLEASGFGSFSGVGSGDTINSVTATVNQWASAATLGAPTYQLWDGTAAQIGADATGSVSTSTSNTDSPSWTGVTYSQLATLRFRVSAHQGSAASGVTQSVDWVGLTVNYTPSGAQIPDLVMAQMTGA
jgi:hypothetical protein